MTATSGRPAAFFDLDKTIIAKSSTLAFSRPFYQGGLISRASVLRSGYAQFVFLVGGADHDQMERMRRYLSDQAAGWNVQTVKDIVADALHHVVDPLVYDVAVELI
jgi:phosphoserine phosphatase